MYLPLMTVTSIIETPLVDANRLTPASNGAPTTEWLLYAAAIRDMIWPTTDARAFQSRPRTKCRTKAKRTYCRRCVHRAIVTMLLNKYATVRIIGASEHSNVITRAGKVTI